MPLDLSRNTSKDSSRSAKELSLAEYLEKTYEVLVILPDENDDSYWLNGAPRPDALIIPRNQKEFGGAVNKPKFDYLAGLRENPVCGNVEFYKPQTIDSELKSYILAKILRKQANQYVIDLRHASKEYISENMDKIAIFIHQHMQLPPLRILFVSPDGISDSLYSNNIGNRFPHNIPRADKRNSEIIAVSDIFGGSFRLLDGSNGDNKLDPFAPSSGRLQTVLSPRFQPKFYSDASTRLL